MTKRTIEFKSVVENLHLGIGRCSSDSRQKFLYLNPEFCHMFYIKENEYIKISLKDIFCDKRRYKLFMGRLKDNGFVHNFESRFKSKNHKTFWGRISAQEIYNHSVDKPVIDITIDNVSESQNCQQDLTNSKELFQTVFNNTAAAITVTDKNEKIVAWNPFAQEMLDMEREELFNKPVKDLYPAKEWRRMRAFRIRRKGMLPNIETQIFKRDGSLLDVNVSVSVLKDTEGNVIGSIGIIQDITNQKVAERKLKESESKIRIILDNSAAAITLIDAQERIVSWNKYTEHLLGMKGKELYLKPVNSIYPSKEWKKIRAENIRKKGSKHHLETKVVNKDGKVIDIDLSINILRNNKNEILGAVGIMQDITEQKRFKEMLVQAKTAAEEANESKSIFLANMSHEVRTPMNTIIGMLDLTLDTDIKGEQRENLLVAKDAADNLLSLINDILDLSRVEAGKITLENINISIKNVVNNVSRGLSVLAKAKNLRIETNIDPKIPEVVEGDAVRLRQILINLINNAIKFTSKGSIKINVELLSKIKGKATIKFSVIDKGIGIPKEKQDKVFETFTQADTSTTRKYGGTGLGLAISKKLVELMNGKIWVESEECKGSAFQFTAVLKISKVSKSSLLAGSYPDQSVQSYSGVDLKDTRILLAEDNVVNQKIVVRMLEKIGCKMESVEDGESAVKRALSGKFDAVLMDAQMPILDGLQATNVIRNKEKKTGKHIPIIALTARAMHEDKKKCLNSGMDGYVSKPIDRNMLFNEIAKLIKERRSHG